MIQQPTSTTAPKITTPTDSSTPTSDMSDWKTYRNEEYGFEFKYPNSWILNSSTPYADLSGGASGLIDIVDWEKLRESIPNCGNSLEKVNVGGKEIVRIQKSCFGQLDSIGYEIESNSKRIGIRFKPSNNKDGSSVEMIDNILSTFKFAE